MVFGQFSDTSICLWSANIRKLAKDHKSYGSAAINSVASVSEKKTLLAIFGTLILCNIEESPEIWWTDWRDPGILGGFLRTLKNGQCRYKYLVTGRDRSYFVNKKQILILPKSCLNWYHQNACVFDWQQICYVWWTCFSRQLAFLLVPCFSSPFIYTRQTSYFSKTKRRSFNFTFRYDVISLYNSRFGDIVDRIYPIELEINDTTDTASSASHL